MTPTLPPNGQFHSESYQLSASGWVARILGLVLLLTLLIVGFIIAIPIVIALLVLGLILYIYIRIRLFFKRAHDPNGPLDGRHNVKVIDRDES